MSNALVHLQAQYNPLRRKPHPKSGCQLQRSLGGRAQTNGRGISCTSSRFRTDTLRCGRHQTILFG